MDTASRRTQRSAITKIRNVAAVQETLVELGVDPATVLRRAGVDPNLFSNPENVMPYTALGRLMMESVKTTGCESFGLRVGCEPSRVGIGLTGLVSIHSPTVREGLDVITATLRTSETGGATFLDMRRGVASFGYAVTATGIESADQIGDAAIAIAFNVMRRLCGAGWRPERVRLTRGPPRDRTPFAKFFEAPVEFGAARGCLVFDAAILDRPAHDRDPHVAGILAPLLQEAAANAQGDFLSTARSVIRTQTRRRGAVARQRLPRAVPEPAHLRPSARGARRSPTPASPTRPSTRRRRAGSSRGSRSPRRRPGSASPIRAPSPAPSRPGRERRRRAGGPSAAANLQRTR